MSSDVQHNPSARFDVLVIGTGLAGLSAALQASAMGARVAVLDKAPTEEMGGSSRTAGGLIAIPNAKSTRGKQEYIEDFMNKSHGRADIETFKLMADHAIDDVAWLERLGARFTPPEPVLPYRVHGVFAAPGQAAGMPDLIKELARQFIQKGGTILFDVCAQELILDANQRVCGVTATGPNGASKSYHSVATVLASGGYAANSELLKQHVGANASKMMVRGAKVCTGDGLRLALRLGAATTNMEGLASLHVAAVSSADPVSGNPFQAVPHCISVNSEGKRFVDESLGYVAHGKAALTQPGQRVALLFDETLRQNPAIDGSIGVFRQLGLDIVEAGSVQELAVKIDVPANALAQTIHAFNESVSNGAAPTANPPKRVFANKLEKPKFYAFFPLIPGVTLTFGGLITNTAAQVLKASGQAIAGLYAAGEIVGGQFYDDYIGGGSLAKCLVMGRIAGKMATQEKRGRV